jgi:hypothetical protein
MATSEHHIPTELIRKILILVFADSVHSICLSSAAPTWEMQVAGTMSSVSFAFNEIMKEVASKAFEVLPEDGARCVPCALPHWRRSRAEYCRILSIVHDNLVFLRNLGIKCREPFQELSIARLPSSSHTSHLIQGYALYLTAIALRVHAAQTLVTSLFIMTHHTVRSALSLSQRICYKIQPQGMAVLLIQSVEREMAIVETGAGSSQF